MKIRDDKFGFQAQIGAFGAESRINQGEIVSGKEYYFYRAMADAAFLDIISWTAIPDQVLPYFKDFLQNPKRQDESAIHARIEYLENYDAAGYGNVELTPKNYMKSGREANVYRRGGDVIKHYTDLDIHGQPSRDWKIVRGVCHEEAVDSSMVASMVVAGKPQFEQMVGASYADHKRVYRYIDGVDGKLASRNMRTMRYLAKVDSIKYEMEQLGLYWQDFDMSSNVIYRHGGGEPVAIDLTTAYSAHSTMRYNQG